MRHFLAVIVLLLVPMAARAVEWKFVEADLSIRPDGKATVVYRVGIDPQGTQLHGFYFQGYSERPRFDKARCWAQSVDGKRRDLDIKDLGNKYDVVLAKGEAVSDGMVVYTLTYAADLAAEKHLSRTTSPDLGDLAVLNWSPVQWDDALGYYHVNVYWPATVAAEQVGDEDLAKLKCRTDKSMNDAYHIRYTGTPRNGKQWLTQQIHVLRPAANAHLRIRDYIDASIFPVLAAADIPVEAPSNPPTPPDNQQPVEPPSLPYRSDPPSNYRPFPQDFRPANDGQAFLPLIGIGLALLFILIIAAKHRSMLTAADGLKDIDWLAADWSPPKIVLSSFRKAGKVAEGLDVIEAALFLGVPVNRVLNIMLGVMAAKGAVKLSEDGRIEVLGQAALAERERALADCVGADGKLLPEKVRQLMQKITDALQRKTWDADAEATKKHYREKFGEVFNARAADMKLDAPLRDAAYYDTYYPTLFFADLTDTDVDLTDVVPATFNQSVLPAATGSSNDYASFMSNPACYEGCFVHSACHDACHSACHDACHSACHDACHSACHSACHDACHSACVSGGAH